MNISSIGQDSHKFVADGNNKSLILGGITIDNCNGLDGNSDADVVLHAITNAISGISCINILGKVSDELCLKQGITDSKVYLQRAIETLDIYRLVHISISIEAKRPHLSKHIPEMRKSIAMLLGLDSNHVGITATTGEGLTAFGKGDGIQAFVILTAEC
ncbi:MAG: 2-C-methyl-D-erythritol 2,4-cyclodiphosphate synthase [Fibrobacter sp.]|nr:2-C-methyl-D-erythritol 2,4-cyclodiphosphate synthase [Fibrobacter sp.]